MAEWLGRALQKLLQQFESAWYLKTKIPACFAGFFMPVITEEEKKFMAYWAAQRLHKKQFLRRFSVGLPVAALIAAAILANFLSGWYKRADAALHADSSVIFVVVIAVVAIAVFITVFSAHHKWDRNEAVYQELLNRNQTENNYEEEGCNEGK